MKYLTERNEIAEALNLRKYPVVRINMETPKSGWDSLYEGDYVMVKTGKEDDVFSYTRGYILYTDTEGYYINPAPIFLVDQYTYSDVIEMVRFSNAPTLNPNDTIVLGEEYPRQKKLKMRMMKVPPVCAKFSVPICVLKDVN